MDSIKKIKRINKTFSIEENLLKDFLKLCEKNNLRTYAVLEHILKSVNHAMKQNKLKELLERLENNG